MVQPCLTYLHLISLVAQAVARLTSVSIGLKEMMQPCLTYLHLISLVAQAVARLTSVSIEMPPIAMLE